MRDEEIRSYLLAVEAELRDLPDADRNELVEDLRQHLLEVSAEGEGSLTDQVGSPASYAAELRAATGLGRPATGGGLRGGWAATRRYFRRLTELGTVRSLAAFLPELRPGWWVLRGYLLVVGIPFLTGQHAGRLSLLPDRGGRLTGLVLTGLAIWASVWLGRRAERGEASSSRRRPMLLLLNGAAVYAAVGLLLSVPPPPSDYSYANEVEFELQHRDGEIITNLCPYDAKGKLLEDVRLFDMSGRPVTNVAPTHSVTPEHFPPEEGQVLRPRTVDVRPENSYPRRIAGYDPATQQWRTLTCPKAEADAAPTPAPTRAPRPGSTPAASPSPAPG